MAKRILITGAGGFAGRYLVNLLANEGAEVFGIYHENPPGEDVPGKHIKADIENYEELASLIGDISPDEVYHLAAVSFMPDAEADRLRAYRTNVQGGWNLLEAVASKAPGAATLYVSTSEVYGKVDPSENPVTEDRPINPVTAYATTKSCMETVCRQYVRDPGIRVVIARPFNHTGPGQSDKFVAPAFASQVAKIEAGMMEPVIRTGSLDARRDFTDVRDVVRAYPDIMRKGENGGVYNICSGKPVEIKKILDILLGLCARAEIKHEFDPARMRPSENPVVYGSCAALEKISGWRPSIPLERTLADMLDDLRLKVKIKNMVDYQGSKR